MIAPLSIMIAPLISIILNYIESHYAASPNI